MEEKNFKLLNVTIPLELHKKIKADAALQNITMQRWVMRALKMYGEQRDKVALDNKDLLG